ncbi:MAG TPA: CDP-diacylglycerol--serine O-phosphatidyltransferase [Desulfobacteria bacterium]|nr:CDP-diacylglycerol--serine O-phosphatidyltransferase [Desulfobacteria bacterium]
MEGKTLNNSFGAKVIPSAMTLTNLLFGILSLVFTMEDAFRWAAYAILFAVIMDGMDGRVARRFEASSSFGKELDSLADLVSFGVAPAILTYAKYMHLPFGNIGLAVAIIFALCGAVRLARFNVLNITTHFVGVPITVAGGFVALFSLMHLPALFYPIVSLVLAFLMVSTFKVPKY